MQLHAKTLINACAALAQCPVSMLTIESTPEHLVISALDGGRSVSTRLPWATPLETGESHIWRMPATFLKHLRASLYRPGRDEPLTLEAGEDPGHPLLIVRFRDTTMRFGAFHHTCCLDVPAPALGGSDEVFPPAAPRHPLVAVQAKDLRFVSRSALGFAAKHHEHEIMTAVCLELVAHTPSGTYRQGLSASVPVNRVSLRAVGADEQRLGLFECPVEWSSLADLRAFRAVSGADLRWVLSALPGLRGIAAVAATREGRAKPGTKKAGGLIHIAFLDDHHGLALSAPDGSWSINVPWLVQPYLDYTRITEEIPQAVIVQSPAGEFHAGVETLSQLETNGTIVLQDAREYLAMVTGQSDPRRLESALRETTVAMEHHHLPKPQWLGSAQGGMIPNDPGTSAGQCLSLAAIPELRPEHAPMLQGVAMAGVTRRVQGLSFEPVWTPQRPLQQSARHFRSLDRKYSGEEPCATEICLPSRDMARMRVQIRHAAPDGCRSVAVIAAKS